MTPLSPAPAKGDNGAIYFGADLARLDPALAFAVGTGPSGGALVNPPHVTQYSGRGDPGMVAWDTMLGGGTDDSFFVQRWRRQ